jgi:hypothetical protein
MIDYLQNGTAAAGWRFDWGKALWLSVIFPFDNSPNRARFGGWRFSCWPALLRPQPSPGTTKDNPSMSIIAYNTEGNFITDSG